jgi:hypothetical protein
LDDGLDVDVATEMEDCMGFAHSLGTFESEVIQSSATFVGGSENGLDDITGTWAGCRFARLLGLLQYKPGGETPGRQ